MTNIYHSEATLTEIVDSLTRTSVGLWGETRTRELEGSVNKVARDLKLLLQAKLDLSDPEPYFPLNRPATSSGSEALR